MVSARARTGLDSLTRAVAEELDLQRPASGEVGLERVLAARHRDALRGARSHLSDALEALRTGCPLDLAAEALRSALASLEDLAGRTTPEDVLERIFARFCVGK